MHEIDEIADDCTVFRNGRNVATYLAGTKCHDEVVELMIGREYRHVFPPSPRRAARRAAAAGGAGPRLDRSAERHFAVRRPGEIVGLGGLDGQGQRELLLALFGVLRGLKGEIRIDGKPVASAARCRPRTSASASRSSPRTARPKA